MMTTDPCPMSDLPSTMCAHCRPAVAAPPMDDVVIVARFPARFNSPCDGCERRIREGDVIGKTDVGDYVCQRCWP